MRAHIVENGVIVNTIVVESLDALPGLTLIDAEQHGGSTGWLWDGDTLSAPPAPEVSVAEQIAAIEAAIDAHLDAVAQQHRFADRTRLALRAAYTNPWQELGVAFGTWMDTCNAQAAQGLQDFLDGKIPLQTPAQVIAQLPEFVAP